MLSVPRTCRRERLQQHRCHQAQGEVPPHKQEGCPAGPTETGAVWGAPCSPSKGVFACSLPAKTRSPQETFRHPGQLEQGAQAPSAWHTPDSAVSAEEPRNSSGSCQPKEGGDAVRAKPQAPADLSGNRSLRPALLTLLQNIETRNVGNT